MSENFDAIVLSCGHSINSYVCLGICEICKKKNCSRCLVVIDDVIYCPKCFAKHMAVGP